MAPRLLLVEDDESAGRSIRHALATTEFEVEWVADASAARPLLTSKRFAVAVLGEGLTPESLWTKLEAPDSHVDVVTVLSRSCTTFTRHTLLAPAVPQDCWAAADATPVALSQVESILIRAAVNLDDRQGVFDCNLELMPGRVVAVNGAVVLKLSSKEYRLLEILKRRPGALVSREAIQEVLYRWGEVVGPTAVEAHVSGIRKKLGSCIVENVRGLGYRLSACSPLAGPKSLGRCTPTRAPEPLDRIGASALGIAGYFGALASLKK